MSAASARSGTPFLDLACASRPIRSERACGDQIAVMGDAESTTIVVADGLGHGPEAELAARRACDLARESDLTDVERVIRACDLSLRGTRGAALAVVRIERTLDVQIAIIGNVDVRGITRERLHALGVGGVVGHRVRKVLVTRSKLEPGDLVLVFTDGISSRFSLEPYEAMSAAIAAPAILAAHGKESDDAACVFLRA
jgi:negative regulator of sigma-B (phosphoserine phosphatase)